MKIPLMILVLILVPIILWAQDSNPDGIIGKPSFTLLGGYGTGNIKQVIGNSEEPAADLESYGFRLEVIYPMAKSTSFIFQVNLEKQTQNFPESLEYYKMENKLTGYGFVIGIRLFSSGK